MAKSPMTIDVDATRFNKMLKDIKFIAGSEGNSRAAVDLSVSQLLNRCIRGTKVANPEKILDTFVKKEYTTYQGKRYKLSNKYPESVWRGIQDFRLRRLGRRMQAIGLGQQSWWLIKEQIDKFITGEPKDAKGKVDYKRSRARRQDGSTYIPHENARVVRKFAGKKYGIMIENKSPTMPGVKGAGVIARAAKAHVRQFDKNLTNGLFKDVKKRAKRYPGVFVKPPKATG